MRLPPLTITKTNTGRITIMIPSKYADDHKRKRVSFSSVKKAEEWRREFLKTILMTGENATQLSYSEKEDAKKAIQILEQNHLTISLSDVARFYCKMTNETKCLEKIGTVFQLYKNEIVASTYNNNTKNRIDILWRTLEKQYKNKTMAEFETMELKSLLEKNSSTPHEFNNKLKTLKAFLNWAVKYNYLEKSPAKKIDKKKVPESIIAVVTPEQARKLLLANPEERHVVALLLFSGIRVAELKRLTWDDIEESEHKLIRVLGKNAKTGSTRYIDIQPNLQQFLRQYPASLKHGPIMKGIWWKKWKDIRAYAGVQDARNQCRHSFASYLLARDNDINYVRSQLGHDTKDIFFQHYRALVFKKDADEYWNISPDTLQTSGKEEP